MCRTHSISRVHQVSASNVLSWHFRFERQFKRTLRCIKCHKIIIYRWIILIYWHNNANGLQPTRRYKIWLSNIIFILFQNNLNNKVHSILRRFLFYLILMAHHLRFSTFTDFIRSNLLKRRQKINCIHWVNFIISVNMVLYMCDLYF